MDELSAYASPTEQLRDLLELVRIHLLHREQVMSHAAETTGLGPREAVPLAFLMDYVEAHRVPMTPTLDAALAEGWRLVAEKTAVSAPEATRFTSLAAELSLSRLEQLLLLATLAPQFSSGYQRAFERLVPGYDAGRLPLTALADLVARSDPQRWMAVAALNADARLVSSGLLVIDNPTGGLARTDAQSWVSVSPVVLDAFIHRATLPHRPSALAGMARVIESRHTLDDLPLAPHDRQALYRLSGVEGPDPENRPQVGVVVTGGLGTSAVAEAVAHAAGRELLALSMLAEGRSAVTLAAYRQVALYARLHDLALLIELHAPADVTTSALSHLLESIVEAPQVLIVAGEPVAALARVDDVAFHQVKLPAMSERERAWVWSEALAGRDLEPQLAQRLAASFALSDEEIREVAREENSATTLAPLARVARKKLSAGIEGVAERIETRGDLDDLVVPPECRAELEEIITYVQHIRLVERRYDLASGRGRGTSALFHGPSGTGKTFAASVIARRTGRDLFRIDIAQVVDKYIGETEKRLDRVFRLAEASDSIILFDEADSLFAKRGDGSSNGDRFANMQVNFLLQRMESYSGMSVLTTNLIESIDQAFRRRIQFQVHFPRPSAEIRERLWLRFLATMGGSAVTDDTIGELADTMEMSGAHIRNAVIKAAVYASHSGTHLIDDAMLRSAAQREYRSIGGLIRAPRSF